MSATKDRIAVAMGMGQCLMSRNADRINVLELQRESIEMKTRNKELMEAVGGMVCGGGAKTKMCTSKKNLPPTDKNNVTMANKKIDMDIYSDHPLWPILWYLWREHKQTFV